MLGKDRPGNNRTGHSEHHPKPFSAKKTSWAALNTNFPFLPATKKPGDQINEQDPPFFSEENIPYAQAKFIAHQTANKSYPVLYVLDGHETGLLDAIIVTRKLNAEMIIVAIPNTDRDRDMMPLSTPTYQVKNPQAENFLSFIENELIPHIEKNYRSNGQRTMSGRSLSGLFVMYAFLEKPNLFDNYIGNSAGWYADMNPFFSALTNKAFLNKEQFKGKKLFVANSLADRFDPNQEVHQAMLEFSKKVASELGDKMLFKYLTYEHYGHVSYPGFYDGLKYILESE